MEAADLRSAAASRLSAGALAVERFSAPTRAVPRLYRAKAMIFREGDDAEAVYQIVDGAVRLLRTTADGRRQLVGFACPGEWLAVGVGEAYTHTAEALVDCRLRPMSRAEMDARMKEDRAFLKQMLQEAASKLQQAEDQMLLLGQKSALEKVAAFLVMIARRLAAPSDGGAVRLPMDRADIADYLGLTIETVSRKFTQLKRAGVIELPTPSRVRIVNRWMLESIVDGEPLDHPSVRRLRQRANGRPQALQTGAA